MATSAPESLNLAGKTAVLGSSVLPSLALSGLTSILPQIQAHFADTPGAAAITRFLITSIGLAMIFGAPIAGILADRFGRRTLLLSAIVLYALAGCAGTVIDNLWLLVASRILLGLATAATGTLFLTILTTAFEGDQRNRWIGYLTITGTACALVILPLAGLLGRIDWRIPFLLHLVALPIFILTAVGIRGAHAGRAAPLTPGEAAAVPSRQPIPYRLIMLGIAIGVVATTVPLFLPFHLYAIGETDPAAIATAMLPGAIVAGVASAFYARLRRSYSARAIFIGGFAIGGIGLFGVGMGASFLQVVAAQTLGAVGVGLLSPNLFSLAAMSSAPEQRGRVMGMTRGGFYAGPFLAQIVLEPVNKAAGAGVAIIALGAFAVAVLTVLAAQPKALAPASAGA